MSPNTKKESDTLYSPVQLEKNDLEMRTMKYLEGKPGFEYIYTFISIGLKEIYTKLHKYVIFFDTNSGLQEGRQETSHISKQSLRRRKVHD